MSPPVRLAQPRVPRVQRLGRLGREALMGGGLGSRSRLWEDGGGRTGRGQKAECLCPGSVDTPRGSELEAGAGEAGLGVFCCLRISQDFACLVSH